MTYLPNLTLGVNREAGVGTVKSRDTFRSDKNFKSDSAASSALKFHAWCWRCRIEQGTPIIECYPC